MAPDAQEPPFWPAAHDADQAQHIGKQAHEKYCADCGAIISAKAEICPKCGVRQMSPPATRVHGGRNRVVAAIFALFLGGFGAHHFYLGNTGRGIVYLLFCWTLIPGLIAFFEAIMFLLMADVDFDLKYNRRALD